MIEFVDLVVRSFDLDHLDLEWTIRDTTEDVERYDFYVLRSTDGPGGPFREIAGPIRNTNMLRDPAVNQLHEWRKYFYKVRAVNKDTSKVVEVGPEFLGPKADLIASELRRRTQVAVTEFNGRKCLVYPRITSGFRCPHCFDGSSTSGRSIGRAKIENCATCFDTTFVGGFHTPLISYVQIDPAAKTVQRTDNTERGRQDSTCRLSAFPPLKPKDMIVEAENIRWSIEKVGETQKHRAPVHQEPTIHRIPLGDIRYKIPVDAEKLEDPSPERAFTRPMCLGNEVQTPLTDLLDGLLGD